jgi:hypothetical protein
MTRDETGSRYLEAVGVLHLVVVSMELPFPEFAIS